MANGKEIMVKFVIWKLMNNGKNNKYSEYSMFRKDFKNLCEYG